MSDKKRKILVPQYMQQFACIGSVCEDTCCVGWTVNIDQATYKKYGKVRELELKPLLDKKVTRNRSNPNADNYAKIKLESGGRCPLLDEKSLCKLQSKLGEEYLSDVCATYPRVANQINGVLEKSATMSCPEAARLALLNPTGIDFDEIEESVEQRNRVLKKMDTRASSLVNKVDKYFWELRMATIQILQNRQYSVADRLVVLGMLFHKVQEYVEGKQINEIPNLLTEYTRLINEGSMNEGLQNIPVLYAIQMELMKELSDVRIVQGLNSTRYGECFVQYMHGIQYSEGSTVEEIAERYKAVYELYYKPFMDQHEYIMENYLVNYVFKNTFPCGGYPTVVDEYIMLVVHYAMIKLQLIGMAGFHKEEFHVDHVLKLIQSFSKSVEHNTKYLQRVLELLKSNNYTSMAYMAILIKN